MQMKMRMFTTHVDKHNEMISVGALEDFVRFINTQYTPMGVEHDPRIPPVGRVISASIIELEDGEYAVDGIAEIFENVEEIEYKDDGREIPIYKIGDTIEISPDRSYLYPEDEELLKEISLLVNGEITHQVKKAEEPISLLIIATSFIAGGIATGFFGKIGEDIWDTFKVKLANLVNAKRRANDDRLLAFDFIIEDEENPLCLETILMNPSESDISKFLGEGLIQLDKKTNRFFQHRHYIRKIVFEYKDNNLQIIFGLRKDGVPLSISDDE